MSKSEKIINLTSNKTKQFSLTLNNELINLFKQAITAFYCNNFLILFYIL